jgi:hypothetical protein
VRPHVAVSDVPTWMVLLACAVAVGAALGSIAPESWGLAPADGLLLGSALYMAAWKRFVERREVDGGIGASGWGGFLAGLSLRAAIFLLLVCAQAFLCFHVIPDADVRRGFVVLSAWVVMLALIDTGTAPGGAIAASRPPRH